MENNKKFSLHSILYNRNITMVISFVIAIFIWLGISLNQSPEIERTIKDVKVTIDESVPGQLGYKAYGADDLTIDVTVKGKRYLVGDNVLTKEDIVVTAITSYVDSAGSYSLQLRATAKNSNAEFTITDKSLDYVEVYFDRPKTKDFEIQTNLTVPKDLLFSDEYITDTPVLSVDMVTISGPAAEIDKIASVSAIAEAQSELKKSETYEADLSVVDQYGGSLKHLSYDTKGIQLTITVPIYKKTTLPVSVEFSNTPLYYINNPLTVTASPSNVNLGIPEDQFETMTSVAVGTIDFNQIKIGKNEFVFPVSKVSGVKITDDVENIIITIDTSNYTSRYYDIPKSSVSLLNVPDGYKVTLESATVTGINIIGPKAEMDSLSADDVFGEINLENVSLTAGKQTVNMQVRVKNNKCWEYGTYTAVLNIEES